MEVSAYERLLTLDQSRGRTYLDEGWLPPEAQCAELAPLRAEHLRLLDVVAEASAKLSALTREAQTAEDRRADAVRDAILSGGDPARVKVEVPDAAEVERARRDYETAVEALTVFVGRAVAEIEDTAPAIEQGIAERVRLADAKRQEARRLLAEADQLSAEPARMKEWLARYVTVTDAFSGEQRKRSVLGPIAFSAMDLPVAVEPPPLISEIVLGPAEAMEIGSDDLTDEEKEAMTNAAH